MHNTLPLLTLIFTLLFTTSCKKEEIEVQLYEIEPTRVIASDIDANRSFDDVALVGDTIYVFISASSGNPNKFFAIEYQAEGVIGDTIEITSPAHGPTLKPGIRKSTRGVLLYSQADNGGLRGRFVGENNYGDFSNCLPQSLGNGSVGCLPEAIFISNSNRVDVFDSKEQLCYQLPPLGSNFRRSNAISNAHIASTRSIVGTNPPEQIYLYDKVEDNGVILRDTSIYASYVAIQQGSLTLSPETVSAYAYVRYTSADAGYGFARISADFEDKTLAYTFLRSIFSEERRTIISSHYDDFTDPLGDHYFKTGDRYYVISGDEIREWTPDPFKDLTDTDRDWAVFGADENYFYVRCNGAEILKIDRTTLEIEQLYLPTIEEADGITRVIPTAEAYLTILESDYISVVYKGSSRWNRHFSVRFPI